MGEALEVCSVNFSPESAIERAFVQSFNWPLDRLWHQADRNGDIGDLDKFLGQSAALGYHYAVARYARHVNTITSAMDSCVGQLSNTQRQGLFRTCSHVVGLLLEINLKLTSSEVQMFVGLLYAVVQTMECTNFERAEMLTKLGRIVGHRIPPEKIHYYAALCKAHRDRVGLVLEHQLKKERKGEFRRLILPTDD